ncbi:hypothetical protein IF1G_05296 [Cordyceps javanica]|uniref:Uncharacterized protein n=1 Tax=Cordyceps javanica TaxID=43265 RepID=A0A545V199_9HYPO|nr:hypothetical protein IF1G_05296 [Cordyceps javanica]
MGVEPGLPLGASVSIDLISRRVDRPSHGVEYICFLLAGRWPKDANQRQSPGIRDVRRQPSLHPALMFVLIPAPTFHD